MIARASVVVCVVALGCAGSRQEVAPASVEATRVPDPSPTMPADADPSRASASDLPPLPRDVVAVVNGVEIPAKDFHAIYDPLVAKALRGSPQKEERARRRAAQLARDQGLPPPPPPEARTKVTVDQDQRARKQALRTVVYVELLRQKAAALGVPWSTDVGAVERAVLERMGELEVPRAEIDDAFERLQATPGWKETSIRVSMITVTVKEGDARTATAAAELRAKDIYERARKPGADFAAIARAESSDEDTAASGGDIGVVGPDSFSNLTPLLAHLKVGDVHPPQLQGRGQFVIYKLTGRWKPGKVPRSAVEPQLIEELAHDVLVDARARLPDELMRNAKIVDHVAPTLEILRSDPPPSP